MKQPFFPFACLLLTVFLAASAPRVCATVDDALSFAHEAATPYVRQGFTIREDAWGGDLGVGDQKAVAAQLFRGNEYWFCLATDVKSASLTIAIYDSKGNLAQAESWTRGQFAGARIVPKRTGTYYVIVTVKRSPVERTPWALVYGFR